MRQEKGMGRQRMYDCFGYLCRREAVRRINGCCSVGALYGAQGWGLGAAGGGL